MRINISVIIPSYNRQQTLNRAICSILKQNYHSYEVIIVDDGSNDDTKKFLKSNYSRVKYVWKANGGVSSARNFGIKMAKGKYIAFLDSDDEWSDSDKILMQLNLMQKENTKICHSDEQWIRNGNKVNQLNKHQKYSGNIYDKILDYCRVSPSTVIIEKSIFDDVGLFDENLQCCEDYDLWLRIATKYRYSYIDKKLINKYGGHDDQLSFKYKALDKFRIITLEKLLNGDILNKNQELATLEEILKKLHILRNGAIKRDLINDVKIYDEKILRYKNRLCDFSSTIL